MIDFGMFLFVFIKEIGKEVVVVGGVYLDSFIGWILFYVLEGKFNLMCFGDVEVYVKVELVLKDFGENVFYFGELGMGYIIKLINNFFV